MIRKIRAWLGKQIPSYAAIPLTTALLWNQLVYNGSRFFTGDLFHYDCSTKLDELLAVVPWSVSVYFLAFPFWVYGYLLCVQKNEEQAMRFLSADFLAKAVCLLFFLFFPTANIRPDISGDGFWEILLRWLYRIDAADNLFPSIHCLVSWLCFAGVRNDRDIPAGKRAGICVMAGLVMLSTLLTRQHVLIDVIGGTAVAELSWQIAGHTAFSDCYKKIMKAISAGYGRLTERFYTRG